jgi:hypothetical protein|tara:strand:- start:290 stop:517 length:228 start_codon:yes stop_codon:yes gene_type:complete
MAKSELDKINEQIKMINDPAITFISAINQGLVIPQGFYTAQQKLQPILTQQKDYASYSNLHKVPTNYIKPGKNND